MLHIKKLLTSFLFIGMITLNSTIINAFSIAIDAAYIGICDSHGLIAQPGMIQLLGHGIIIEVPEEYEEQIPGTVINSLALEKINELISSKNKDFKPYISLPCHLAYHERYDACPNSYIVVRDNQIYHKRNFNQFVSKTRLQPFSDDKFDQKDSPVQSQMPPRTGSSNFDDIMFAV